MELELLGLDPLFSTNAKLSIKDVLSLKRVENVAYGLYHFYDHIIKLVDVCGVVVGVENRRSYINYYVDDNSGVIACCFWKDQVSNNVFELGNLVQVYGKIETSEEDRTINGDAICQY